MRGLLGTELYHNRFITESCEYWIYTIIPTTRIIHTLSTSFLICYFNFISRISQAHYYIHSCITYYLFLFQPFVFSIQLYPFWVCVILFLRWYTCIPFQIRTIAIVHWIRLMCASSPTSTFVLSSLSKCFAFSYWQWHLVFYFNSVNIEHWTV